MGVVLGLAVLLALPASGSTVVSGTYLNTLSYQIADGEVTITDCKHARDYEFTVPAYIEGYPVTAIGNRAFETYCPNILHLPETLVSIGDNAFSHSRLYQLTIPDSVKTIGRGIVVGTSLYSKAKNWDNGLLYIGKHLVATEYGLSGKVVVKEGILTIAYGVFSLKHDVTEVVLPSSIKHISNSAFYECTGLEKVTLGSKVTDIGDNAFYGCTSLKGISLPDTLERLGDACFMGCTSLTEFTLPEAITKLPGGLLCGCTSLNIVNLHSGITEICEGVLTNTAYYNNASNWEGVALYKDKYLFDVDPSKEIRIKEGTEIVANNVFVGIRGVDSVYFPDSVKYIPAGLFKDSQVKYVKLSAGATEMGKGVFENCRSLITAELPKKITSIPEDTFVYCVALESVEIPDGIKIIESCAFNFTALKSVVVPDSVVEIGNWAFGYCSMLESVVIGGGVKTCGTGIFSGSYSLKSCHYRGSEDDFEKIGLEFSPYHHFLVITYDIPTYGDINGDGSIDSDDAVYLLYSMTFGSGKYPLKTEYDLNNDGSSDSEDAVYLLYHIMFGREYYPLHKKLVSDDDGW